jgi:hypothetical protein
MLSRAALCAVLIFVAAAVTARADEPPISDPIPVASAPGLQSVVGAARNPDGSARVVLAHGAALEALDVRPGATPQRIASTAGASPAAQLLVAADGSQTVVWSAGDSVFAADAPPGGAFGAAQTVAPARLPSRLTAAGTGDGTVVVLWSELHETSGIANERVQIAVRRPGQPFSEPQVLFESTVSGIDVAGGPGGTAVVAWSSGTSTALSHLVAGGTTFGPAESLDLAGGALSAVIGPDGTVYVSDGAHVARRAADGTALSTQDLGSAPAMSDLAFAPDGTLGAVRVDSIATPTYRSRVLLSVAHEPDGFGAPVDLGDPQVLSLPQLFLWNGGAAAVTTSADVGDAGLLFSGLFATGGAGGIVTVGPTVAAVPSTTPGSISLFTAYDGTVYRFDRPGAPDHRAPKVKITTAFTMSRRRATSARVAVTPDKDVTVTPTARVRVHGRWRAARAVFPFGPHPVTTADLLPFDGGRIDIPVPASLRACHTKRPVRVELTLRVRDRAGDVVRTTRRFSQHCAMR